jgi:hypothetical protein
MPTVRASPFLDGPRDVRSPHERYREDQEEEVVLPVVQFNHSMERMDGARCRSAAALEVTLKGNKSWRRERLAFESSQEFPEHVEVARRGIGAVRDTFDALLLWPGEGDLHAEDDRHRH